MVKILFLILLLEGCTIHDCKPTVKFFMNDPKDLINAQNLEPTINCKIK